MAITDKTADVLLFTPGRAPCASPLAIVLHGYSSGLEMLDLEMERCPRPRPRQSTGCHTSFHYGVDGCNVHQYVALANTAWGFGVTPPTCPAPICPPDECESCTGLTVAQYNPDLDGNDPVLPAFAAGTDGTANSCVIHVAVTGQSGFSALDAYGECCRWMEKSYACFVRSLCAIFQASGLVPSQTTLLVHCQELLCIDIDQLVIDINTCLNTPPAPPPPCNCQATTVTPGAVCDAIETFTVSAVAATSALGPDCQFHPIVATDVTVVGVDTTTVDITVVEGPANTFTISAETIADPDFLCEELKTLTQFGEGINIEVIGITQDEFNVCGRFTLPVQDIQALDTSSVDTTVVEGPDGTFTVSATVTAITPAILCDVVSEQAVLAGPAIPAIPGVTTFLGTDCDLYTTPSTPTLRDCQDNILDASSDVKILTVPVPTDVAPVISTDFGLLRMYDTGCVTRVLGPDCTTLEGRQALEHTPQGYLGVTCGGDVKWVHGWQNPATTTIDPVLNLNAFAYQQSGKRIYIVNGDTFPSRTIASPTDCCSNREIWVKNIGTGPLTLTASAGTIDGQASIVLDGIVVAGYPFGNNGGEAVHLVWDDATTQWYVV